MKPALDPTTLRVPSNTASSDIRRQYIAGIAAVSELTLTHPHGVLMRENAWEVLSADMEPTRAVTPLTLTELTRDIEEVDANTIFHLILSIADRAGSLDSVAACSSHTFASLSILPTCPQSLDELTFSLATIAASTTNSSILVLSSVTAPCLLNCTLHDVLLDGETTGIINHQSLCARLEAIPWKTPLAHLRGVDIWNAATKREHLALAIQCSSISLRGSSPLRPVVIGRSLLDSFSAGKGAPASKAERTLTAIVETVFRENLGKTHRLRSGRGGNDPPRTRSDAALAWRRDIDYDYHLHYWELTDGTVEIADIVCHNDFTITD